MSDLIELSHQLQDVILELRSAGVWEDTIATLAEVVEHALEKSK